MRERPLFRASEVGGGSTALQVGSLHSDTQERPSRASEAVFFK